jgi:hypothetical protein
MKQSAMSLMWVFLAAPWLAWVSFHPLVDARLAWTLVARPRETRVAVVEMLHNAYDVPPFSHVFDAVRPVYRGRFPDAACGRGHGVSGGLSSRTACFTAPQSP